LNDGQPLLDPANFNDTAPGPRAFNRTRYRQMLRTGLHGAD